MRRRSNRSSKAAEESTEVVSPKKTKRYSRRRKQSTSESDDEPISTLVDKSIDNVADDVHCEPEVWKVTAQSTTEGDIQKLKICLKRPPISPEKGTQKKISSSHDDELHEDKSTLRLLPKAKSNTEEDIHNTEEDIHTEDEKLEDIDDKGKFKAKSSSKTEKLNDSDSCNDEKSQNTQSDDNISGNVQIEPQNVQSDNISKIDGKGSEDVEIEHEEIVFEEQEDSTAAVHIQSTKPVVEVIENVVVMEATNQSEADSKSAIARDNSNESTSHITPPIPLKTEQMLVCDEEPEKAEQENQEDSTTEKLKKIEENKIEECIISQCVNETKNSTDVGTEVELVINNCEHSSNETYELCETTPVLSDREDDMKDKLDSLNATSDELMKMDSVQSDVPSPPHKTVNSKNRMIKTFKEDKETASVDADIPLCDIVVPPPRVCVYPKSMMAKNIVKTEVKPTTESPRLALMKLPKLMTERKRKWGQSANAKDILPALNFVTSNLIADIFPNCKLLDEDKVKLDLPVASSPSTAKVMARDSRKISIEMPKSQLPAPIIKSETITSKENGTVKEGIFDHLLKNDREKADQASIIALNRKISIVEDTAAKLKPPPSPGKNPISSVLYISNLVRPFTLKQLKELLERTGKIVDGGFWTDRIKSKCIAQYESAENAEITRNALHGVNWPIGNGKKLMIEYSTVEELELARNPPPIPPLIPEEKISETPEPSEKENKEPTRRNGGDVGDDHRDHHELRDHRERDAEVRHHQEHRSRRDSSGAGDSRNEQEQQQSSHHVREWDVGKGEEMRRSRSRSRDRVDRRGIHQSHTRPRRSPSPRDYDRYKPHPKVEEPPPQKLMDDLFLKTKTTPCIYWQALTPEEIALKQQQRLERMAEHQRRLQQTTNIGGLGSGGVYPGPSPQQYRGGYSGAGRRRY